MTSPYVRRLRLAAELKTLRAQADLTHEELAKKAGQSRVQISRLENAHVVDEKDLVKILDALEVDGEGCTRILEIARQGAERGWWESHTSVSGRQAFHADLEAGAKTIREFQLAFVPSLLQTPAYTRARAESDHATQGFPLSADDAVEAHLLRQRMVYRSRTRYEVILDAVAVTRLAVPPEVAKAQLYHIGALVNASDRFTVQVLPTDALIAGYAMPRSSFSIHTFEDPGDPAVVTVDTITEDLVHTDDTYVERYEDLFTRLSDASLSPDDSLNLLATTATRTRS